MLNYFIYIGEGQVTYAPLLGLEPNCFKIFSSMRFFTLELMPPYDLTPETALGKGAA